MKNRPQPLRHWWKAAVAMAVLALVLLLVPGLGEVRSDPGERPTVRTAIEGPCLLPAPEMRREHKALLFKERTMAVRHGIRDPEASLTRCVACHAVYDEASQPVSYPDERHFCRSCHMRVAVEPDCFSCHRSTPAATVKAEAQP